MEKIVGEKEQTDYLVIQYTWYQWLYIFGSWMFVFSITVIIVYAFFIIFPSRDAYFCLALALVFVFVLIKFTTDLILLIPHKIEIKNSELTFSFPFIKPFSIGINEVKSFTDSGLHIIIEFELRKVMVYSFIQRSKDLIGILEK